MSSSDDMFPAGNGRPYLDLPMTTDELTALASVLTFTNNVLDALIKDAEKQEAPDPNLEKYHALKNFSKLMYNKVAIVSTIGEPESKVVH